MSVSRRCPNCNAWNEENDYCVQCNHLLNFSLQQEIEESRRQDVVSKLPVDKVEAFLRKLKGSGNWFLVGIYYLLNSVWFVLMGILSFIIAFIAFIAG